MSFFFFLRGEIKIAMVKSQIRENEIFSVPDM